MTNYKQDRLLSWCSNVCPVCKTKQELGSMATVYKIPKEYPKGFKETLKALELEPLFCSVECLKEYIKNGSTVTTAGR